MGFTFAPGLPPLILSLRMSNTGILGAYSTVLAGFHHWLPSNFWFGVSYVRQYERGFSTCKGGK
jgi:hypothetical protein